jgi:putative cardiolipin synthase
MYFRFPIRSPRWSSVTHQAAVWLLLSMAGGCASVGQDVPRVPSYAIGNGEQTTLGRAFAEQAAQHPALSGFQVVTSGHTAFVARTALADAAERTLDLQYYSVGDDLTTDLLLLRIVAAADRGVRVRILLDDINARARFFARRAIAAHPAIQVRLFNPFFSGGTSSLARLGEFVFDGERLNRRMHNKLWAADNAAAVVGSRNLGDEYFDANVASNFADVDLLAAGPIVKELSHAFDAYWNSAAAIPMEAFAERPDAAEGVRVRQSLRTRAANCHGLAPCDWLAQDSLLDALRSASVQLSWGRAQLTYDQPDQEKIGVASGIEHGSIDDREGGSRTAAELLIMSPYFVPSEDGLRHLEEMRERGVRVAVLTNSLASTDSPAAHAGYARHRMALLRKGVELFEMRPRPDVRHRLPHRWGRASAASLHAKVIVQDRVRALVGSLNQDPRSRLHNTEAWITVDSVELAGELAALFDEGSDPHHAFKVDRSEAGGEAALEWSAEERGKIVTHDVEPMTDLGLRLWRGILGVLIPEHML